MHDLGFWQHLAEDLSGKGQFRLIFQPAVAIWLGIRLGRLDAKAHQAPFGFRLFTTKHARWQLFEQSLSDAVMPLTFAILLDAVLQYLTLKHVRPLGALVVGGLLVWLPFVSARGLANRYWTRSHRRDITRGGSPTH